MRTPRCRCIWRGAVTQRRIGILLSQRRIYFIGGVLAAVAKGAVRGIVAALVPDRDQPGAPVGREKVAMYEIAAVVDDTDDGALAPVAECFRRQLVRLCLRFLHPGGQRRPQ